MRRTIVGLVVVLCATSVIGQTNPQQYSYPSTDRITLLLTQSERAFNAYEDALKQQTVLAGDTQESIAKDRQVLDAGRQALARLKQTPDYFNSGMGFLLLGNLDDASRNMAVCMGQAGLESALELQAGKTARSQEKLHLSQACRDASSLLYTVSETAFNMYSEYLLAEHELKNRMVVQLSRCGQVLKDQQKERSGPIK